MIRYEKEKPLFFRGSSYHLLGVPCRTMTVFRNEKAWARAASIDKEIILVAFEIPVASDRIKFN